MAKPNEQEPVSPPAAPIVGGPDGDAEVRPEPKLVAVKYGGREHQMTEEAATAWQEREREYEQRFSRQGAELGDLRKRVSQPVAEPRREEPKVDPLETKWFEAPTEAARILEDRITQRLESRYTQERALDQFWDGFYRGNDDLREDEWVVKGVFRDHFEEFADLPRSKAQEKLAELTREKILRLTRKVKPTNDRSHTDLLEAASGDRPTAPVRREEDEGPRSLSETIALRRNQRRAGAKGA